MLSKLKQDFAAALVQKVLEWLVLNVATGELMLDKSTV